MKLALEPYLLELQSTDQVPDTENLTPDQIIDFYLDAFENVVGFHGLVDSPLYWEYAELDDDEVQGYPIIFTNKQALNIANHLNIIFAETANLKALQAKHSYLALFDRADKVNWHQNANEQVLRADELSLEDLEVRVKHLRAANHIRTYLYKNFTEEDRNFVLQRVLKYWNSLKTLVKSTNGAAAEANQENADRIWALYLEIEKSTTSLI